MEKPTFTAIDYKDQQNIIIEGMVGEYYSQVKALIEIVITESIKDDTLDVNGRLYFRVPMEEINRYSYLLGTAFWFPVSKDYNAMRIKILECALEDLERIKREGEPKLPLITEDEPIIY